MSLNLDQIRDYNRGGSLAISDAGGDGPAQIKKTGFWHWIKLCFGNDKAVARNQGTLDALRTAIQNDPRYFDDDVQNRATQLLAGVRADNSISAKAIKGIIAQLDKMSTPVEQRKSVMRLATGHLIALGMPEGAAGMEKAYKDAAVKFTLNRRNGESYADIKVVDRLNEFNAIMGRVFDRLGNDPAARALFAAYVDKGRLFTGKGELKSEDDINTLIDGIKRTVDELDEIGAEHGETVRANVLAGLKDLGAPMPTKVFRSFVDGGAGMPKCGLDKLSANSSAAEIHEAIARFVKSIETKLHAEPFQTDDPATVIWLQKFIGMGMAASLTNDEKKAVLDAFKSDQGKNLIAFYIGCKSGGELRAKLANVLCGLLTQLNTDVDKARPDTMIEFPEQCDHAALPANAIFDFDPELAASGAGAKEVVDGLVKAENSPVKGLGDPNLKTRMNMIAKDTLTILFAQQITEIRQSNDKVKTGKPDFDQMNYNFQVDSFRGFAIVVTIDGKQVKLPNEDAVKARDILTQFLIQDEKAVFAEQSDDIKAKVYMLMSCLHQGCVSAMQSGVSKAFSPETKNNPLCAGRGLPIVDFALSLNGNKDVEIDVSTRIVKRPEKGMGPWMLTRQRGDDADIFFCDDNAYFDYSAKITLPASGMDKYIKADWENYDHAEVKKVSINEAISRHTEKAVQLIPERYRIPVEVDVAFHFHAESVTKMNEDIYHPPSHIKKSMPGKK